jgi:hypothetical protein
MLSAVRLNGKPLDGGIPISLQREEDLWRSLAWMA